MRPRHRPGVDRTRIIDPGSDGGYLFDAEGRLVFVNAAALDNRPFDRDDRVGEALDARQELTMRDPPPSPDREDIYSVHLGRTLCAFTAARGGGLGPGACR